MQVDSMNAKIEIIQIGDSLGIILTPEMLIELDAKLGDLLEITNTPEGILLSNADAVSNPERAVFRRVMRKNRDVLRRLADS